VASIRREVVLAAPASVVWDALRDVGAIHTRLAPGFVVATELEPGGAARVVTFGNGTTARELIVDIDEGARRLAWSVVGGRMTHHNASAQVFDEDGATRFVWIADLLPHDLAPAIAGMIDKAIAAISAKFGRRA
jgi:carbon monoxide dehydrogenase subunit G